jgi:hypothetical protein
MFVRASKNVVPTCPPTLPKFCQRTTVWGGGRQGNQPSSPVPRAYITVTGLQIPSTTSLRTFSACFWSGAARVTAANSRLRMGANFMVVYRYSGYSLFGKKKKWARRSLKVPVLVHRLDVFAFAVVIVFRFRPLSPTAKMLWASPVTMRRLNLNRIRFLHQQHTYHIKSLWL